MTVPGASAPGATLPAAVVVVAIRDRRVLVVRRGPGAPRPGYWMPLSGRVEPGETQPQAVVREAREEAGLAVTPGSLVWQCDTDDQRFRLYWWLACAAPGELALDPVEVSDARWITAAEFGTLAPTFPVHREFFARVLPGWLSSCTG